MNETNKIGPTTEKAGAAPATAPIPAAPGRRGLKFYARGGWMFFKKMWPAIYDLFNDRNIRQRLGHRVQRHAVVLFVRGADGQFFDQRAALEAWV